MAQVATGGIIFNYQELGEFGGVPILILHGWGRNLTEWEGIASELARYSKRKVFLLDLPGFGGSSLPQDVRTIEEYSKLVLDFCDYMKIPAMTLIGHSLGGRVGIVLAATQPTRIKKLVLVDPAGIKPRSIMRVTLKYLAKIFAWVPLNLRRRLVGRLMDADYQNSPALRKLYRAVVGKDLRKYLCEISCPVEVVWGELDAILPLSLTRIYAKELKDRKIRVVWGGTHDPHLNQSEQTLKILQEAI
jgi:pimeloyl-ACP methyl ester carboxylesterase